MNDNDQETYDKQRGRISLPTGEQPLLLYDIATLIGAVYQQPIEATRRGRYTATLRSLLHGLPRMGERQEDQYVSMLFEVARGLRLIRVVDDPWDGKLYYIPRDELGLEEWSQWNARQQARKFLTWWKTDSRWHDVRSTRFQQWDDSDWNPIAARTILLDILQKCQAEQWYSVSSLLDLIWSKAPYALRPQRLEGGHIQQIVPEQRQQWNNCEGMVYRGILASTLSELGIVSVFQQATNTPTGDTFLLPKSFLLTRMGKRVLSKETTSELPRPTQRVLVVQPSFEVLLLQTDFPALYQVLPFVQVNLIEQASRLTLTKHSILRGRELGMNVEQILSVLEKCSQRAIPQNVTYTLHDWAKSYKEVELSEVLFLKVSHEALADELCRSSKFQAFELEKVAPDMVVVHEGDGMAEMQQQLKKAGIVVHFRSSK